MVMKAVCHGRSLAGRLFLGLFEMASKELGFTTKCKQN
jgi:hypothetical protein